MAPGAAGLDTGSIIGIAAGAASLIAATIPLVLVFRKWQKPHDFCGLPATGNVAVNIPMNPNLRFQAPNEPLPTPGI